MTAIVSLRLETTARKIFGGAITGGTMEELDEQEIGVRAALQAVMADLKRLESEIEAKIASWRKS